MKRKLWILPAWADPRWVILAFLFSFVCYALLSPGFYRRPEQFGVAVLVCVGLDLLLSRWRQGINLFPMSAIITSGGTLLLCDSSKVWPYALVAAASILSKHFIKVEGRHVFNPNNFGIVIGTLFFSNDIAIVAARWGGSSIGLMLVVLLGLYAAYRAGRLDLALTYVGGFALGLVGRSYVYDTPLIRLSIPMTGAAFMLFTFYMITDPMTTPSSRKGRIIFGIALAVLDNILRQMQVPNSPFYALFVLCGAQTIWKASEIMTRREDVWKWRTV